MNGIGCSVLGYANSQVIRDVKKELSRGSMTTLNSGLEIELAHKLIALHPWSQKVRFARTGGEILAVAVRMARAATGRTRVLVHGYHGWHDWYLAASITNSKALDNFLLPDIPIAGVPNELANTCTAVPELL